MQRTRTAFAGAAVAFAFLGAGVRPDQTNASGQLPSRVAAACPVSPSEEAEAPPEPRVSPTRGRWHISADRKLWAPAAGSRTPNAVSGYWVRPRGTPLHVRAVPLGNDNAQPVEMLEEGPAEFGFFFGGPAIPTDGCWEITATAGESRVTFVAALRDMLFQFVDRPNTKIVWSKDSGTVAGGGASVAVTAIVLERAGSFTGRVEGARITLRDSSGTVTLYEENARLHGTGAFLDNLAMNGGPMIYGLGRTFNVRADDKSLTFVGEGREIKLPGHSGRDFARLLVAAREDLANAPTN